MVWHDAPGYQFVVCWVVELESFFYDAGAVGVVEDAGPVGLVFVFRDECSELSLLIGECFVLEFMLPLFEDFFGDRVC